MLDIGESINVWVAFRRGVISPFLFIWRGRKIKIDRINLVHKTKTGSSVFYHFSTSSGNNFYRLGFDTTSLKWTLEATEED